MLHCVYILRVIDVPFPRDLPSHEWVVTQKLDPYDVCVTTSTQKLGAVILQYEM
jgi:hypothetical protein